MPVFPSLGLSPQNSTVPRTVGAHPYFGPIFLWMVSNLPKADVFIGGAPAASVGSMGYVIHVVSMLPAPSGANPSQFLRLWERALLKIFTEPGSSHSSADDEAINKGLSLGFVMGLMNLTGEKVQQIVHSVPGQSSTFSFALLVGYGRGLIDPAQARTFGALVAEFGTKIGSSLSNSQIIRLAGSLGRTLY